jgi:hypothetical protein
MRPIASAVVASAVVALAVVGAGLMQSPASRAAAAATAVTPTAPSFTDDTCVNFLPTGASYTIPSTTGVDYIVNGVLTAAGTYGAADRATVTVVAQAQTGFSITGTSSFTHTFPPTPTCTTPVVPLAPSFAEDICTTGGSTGASYTIPSVTGIDYLVNGVKTAGGMYPAADGSKVTVVARAQAGFSLSGTSSFTHTFAATCSSGVTPSPPTFADATCSGSAPVGASYTIPSTTGVDYLVNGVKTAAGTYSAANGSTLTVTAQAQSGFALTGTTSFSHTFGSAPTCAISVTPVSPTFTDGACVAGAKTQVTYTVPAKTGVDYLVNGVKTTAGTFNATDGSTVTITTQAEAGYVLTGTTSFTHAYPSTPTCTSPTTAAAPAFTDATCSRGVPTQATFTIPTSNGVDYLVNGVKTAAGIHNAADGSTVTITAQAKPGYTLVGTSSFAHTFAKTPTCTSSTCPSSSGPQHCRNCGERVHHELRRAWAVKDSNLRPWD